MIDSNTVGDVVTVHKFAEMYHVDASQVRRWAKEGRIDYELFGPRKLRRIRVSSVVKPIEPKQVEAMRQAHNRRQLAAKFVARDGMDTGTAKSVVDSMDIDSVDGMLVTIIQEECNAEPKVEEQNHP